MKQLLRSAKADLEAAGLEVKPSGERGLWIAATARDVGDGLRLSQDACALLQHESGWLAVFPAAGVLSYEVPGELADLLPLIRCVYDLYRKQGGALAEAFRHSVPGAESYLVGRFPPETPTGTLPPPRQVRVGS